MGSTETTQPTDLIVAALAEIRQREQAVKDDYWDAIEEHGVDVADEGWPRVWIEDQDANPVAFTFMSHVLEPGDEEAYTDFIAHSLEDMSRLLRVVEAVKGLCRDTDGNWLEPSSSLPVSEFQAALGLLCEGGRERV